MPIQHAQAIQVPIGFGANTYEGLHLGPRAILSEARDRIHRLQLDEVRNKPGGGDRLLWLDRLLNDPDDDLEIAVRNPPTSDDCGDYETIQHLPTIEKACTLLRDEVARQISDPDDPKLPLVLGGDHSIAIGTAAGLLQHIAPEDLGIIWIDNHADINTGRLGERFGVDEYSTVHGRREKQRRGTTLSGHVHGMPLSAIINDPDMEPRLRAPFKNIKPPHQENFALPQNIVLIGLRDLDREERVRLLENNIRCHSARQIVYRGLVEIVRDTLAYLQSRSVRQVYISFDIDSIDATSVPGTGTPAPGGLSFCQADLLLKLLCDWLPKHGMSLAAFELVEVNPLLDDCGRTVELAGRLVCTALGEKNGIDDSF